MARPWHGEEESGGSSGSALPDNQEAAARGTHTNLTESTAEPLPLSVYVQAPSDLSRGEKSISHKTAL